MSERRQRTPLRQRGALRGATGIGLSLALTLSVTSSCSNKEPVRNPSPAAAASTTPEIPSTTLPQLEAYGLTVKELSDTLGVQTSDSFTKGQSITASMGRCIVVNSLDKVHGSDAGSIVIIQNPVLAPVSVEDPQTHEQIPAGIWGAVLPVPTPIGEEPIHGVIPILSVRNELLYGVWGVTPDNATIRRLSEVVLERASNIPRTDTDTGEIYSKYGGLVPLESVQGRIPGHVYYLPDTQPEAIGDYCRLSSFAVAALGLQENSFVQPNM